MATSDWQPVATVGAAVLGALIAASVAFLNRRDDSLGKAERLSKVADGMTDSPSRQLVKDLRDGYVVEWSLHRMAPRMPLLNGIAMVSYVLALLSFVSLLAIFVPVTDLQKLVVDANFWAAYGAVVLTLAVAQIARAWVIESRQRWVAQERTWRGLEAPVPDRQKRVKVDFKRVLALASPFNLFLTGGDKNSELADHTGG